MLQYMFVVFVETVPRKQKYEEENRYSKRLKTNKNKKTENGSFLNQNKVSGKKQFVKIILPYNAHRHVAKAAEKRDVKKKW